MKYPVGTRCWLIFSFNHKAKIGSVVEILSLEVPDWIVAHGCKRCGSHSRLVEVSPGYWSACCCMLVPIDDPDAAERVEESEELHA